MTAAAACSLGDIGDASVIDADVVATALEVEAETETGRWLACAAVVARWGR
jgi:hypothetical protein